MNRKLFSITGISAVIAVLGSFGCQKFMGNDLKFVEDKVKANLIDPSSAQFKSVVFYDSTKGACGLVNSKNKLGGYVGFKRFVITQNDDVMFDPEFDHTNRPTLRSPSFSSDPYLSADSVMRVQKQYESEMYEYRRNLDIQIAFEDAVNKFCPINVSDKEGSASTNNSKESEKICTAWENRNGEFVQVKSKCD